MNYGGIGMSNRFMVDDAGTLIDMSTRDTYDYVSDVVDVLNGFVEEQEYLKFKGKQQKEIIKTLIKENEQLKQQVQNIHKLIDKKIEEADNEFKDYHPERENDIILAKWRALVDLKDELNGDVE